MRILSLSKQAQVKLDANGNGTASTGPSLPGEVWTPPITASVRATTNVNEAICTVYAGWGVDPVNFQDATTWGSTGDSDNSINIPLHPGQYVFAVWSGGDSGATATINVTGTRQVP